MNKFTKEEISLYKQVAEKHRKEIVFGDWFYDEGLKKITIYTPYPHGEYTLNAKEQKRFNYVPLWTISDCLEFLEERGLNLYLQFMRFENGNWRLTAEDDKYKKVRGEGKTRLEACLKAVLAVLEEKPSG